MRQQRLNQLLELISEHGHVSIAEVESALGTGTPNQRWVIATDGAALKVSA